MYYDGGTPGTVHEAIIMFVCSDIISCMMFRRLCLFLGQNSCPVFALHGKKYFRYKELGKHFIGCSFSLPFTPTKRLFRCTSSGLKDELDGDDGIGFYEANLVDISEARQLLYPDSEDPLVRLLNLSSSVQDVFDVIKTHEADISACSLSQAVLVLWDLQKVFYEVNVKNWTGVQGVEYPPVLPEEMFRNYVSQIRAHHSFEHLLELLDARVPELSTNALMSMVLYLAKLGVEMHHTVMHSLLSRCLHVLMVDGEDLSLLALSRFIAAVQSTGLWSAYMMKDAMPLIFHKMERCRSAEDFQLVTACLTGSHRLLHEGKLGAYKRLAEDLVSQGLLTGQHPRALLKAAYLLNYPPWSWSNCSTVRLLLLQLVGSVHALLAPDLVCLHRVFSSQLEPAELLEEMRAHTSRLLAGSDTANLQSRCELLECIVTFSLPSQKPAFEALALDHLNDASFASCITPLFKVLRHLKTSDTKLCNHFWSLTTAFLQAHEEEREDYKLLKICYRYMHFNSHLGGLYRHLQFEGCALQWLWECLSTEVTGFVPSKFSQLAGFALAYASGHSPGHQQLLTLVLRKLPAMLPQFSEIDCLNVSRGLQVGMRLHWRDRRASPQLLWDLAGVNAALDGWSLSQLRRPLLLQDVNLVMKAYMCRRGGCNTELFHRLALSFENSTDDLSSRLLRGISMNLALSRCLLPRVMERMAEYSITNHSHILGETVEKLLNLCYTVGHCPEPRDRFLSAAANIVLRDKEQMSGMALLQSALALCLFQHLPHQLIYYIFTVDFMERLDQEIAQCYSKATYPTRVRRYLMLLNRAVCLDYPEASVPWFHEKYVQQVAAQEPTLTSSFSSDVEKAVAAVVGGKEFVKSRVYSPYGYLIDFQVMLDENKRPVATAGSPGSGNMSRVAVLLHKEQDLSVHKVQLTGPSQLKQRHLELLGYTVLGISESCWHSMYMSEPRAKLLFLQERLFK